MDPFICNVLKRRREELGLSQDELAERIGVESRTIRRIENNEVKQTRYLEAICTELNMGFKKSSVADIESKYMAFTFPNVTNGLELAHLLYQSDYLDYYSKDELDIEENLTVDRFVEKCSEMISIIDHLEVADRRTIVNCLTNEITTLNKTGLFIYGSCNDLLINDFKFTELVFIKM